MLKVVNLTKVFNKDLNPEDHKTALDNISLEVEPGDFVTVIGGKGAGNQPLNAIVDEFRIPPGFHRWGGRHTFERLQTFEIHRHRLPRSLSEPRQTCRLRKISPQEGKEEGPKWDPIRMRGVLRKACDPESRF